MMTVNAFWFGFLIAMVVILVLVIVLALIKAKQDEREWEEYQPTDEELQYALKEITGKKFKITRSDDGYMVGEMVEDDDNES